MYVYACMHRTNARTGIRPSPPRIFEVVSWTPSSLFCLQSMRFLAGFVASAHHEKLPVSFSLINRSRWFELFPETSRVARAYLDSRLKG